MRPPSYGHVGILARLGFVWDRDSDGDGYLRLPLQNDGCPDAEHGPIVTLIYNPENNYLLVHLDAEDGTLCVLEVPLTGVAVFDDGTSIKFGEMPTA